MAILQVIYLFLVSGHLGYIQICHLLPCLLSSFIFSIPLSLCDVFLLTASDWRMAWHVVG